jgi:dihydrofolate synthase / folylpolyglutamate synthase
MDYAAAVEALTSRGRFGMSLGLERIDRLFDELGRPERALHGALIAGTNGKGSVVAIVDAVLRAARVRTGTMPKPHLVSYRERIRIDGESLSASRFAAAVAAILPAADRVQALLGPPTEFEALTAAAVAELARERVDLAIVEVGMGGRLDATNALDLGVAAVTNVQHDHERHLGRTLVAIGTEKAAIIKPRNLAVSGASGRGLRPIVERCAELDVSLRMAGVGRPYGMRVLDAGWDGLVLEARRAERPLGELRLGMLGSHQAHNAAVALGVLDALVEDAARDGRRLFVSDEAIRTGFGTVHWPGRLELLQTEIGPVLLDGAHNPAGARALGAALAELGLRRFGLVFGAMRGKRVASMLRALAPLDPRPVFTSIDDPGARSAHELLATWRRVAPAGAEPGAVEPSLRKALRRAAAAGASDQPIVVAGSLYVVGAARGMLIGQEEVA